MRVALEPARRARDGPAGEHRPEVPSRRAGPNSFAYNPQSHRPRPPGRGFSMSRPLGKQTGANPSRRQILFYVSVV